MALTNALQVILTQTGGTESETFTTSTTILSNTSKSLKVTFPDGDTTATIPFIVKSSALVYMGVSSEIVLTGMLFKDSGGATRTDAGSFTEGQTKQAKAGNTIDFALPGAGNDYATITITKSAGAATGGDVLVEAYFNETQA